MRTALRPRSVRTARWQAALATAFGASLGIASMSALTAQEAKPDRAAPSAAAQPAAADNSSRSNRERKRDRRGGEQATAAAAETATASAETPTQVCRSLKLTGTRLPKRVCDTPENWAALDAQSAEGVREMRRVGGDAGASNEALNQDIRTCPPAC